MRLLVSAGGTGGGIYPALSVVAGIRGKAEVLWVGGKGGMEEDLVARAGIPFRAISAAGLHGVGVGDLPSNLWQVLHGIFEARSVIRQFQPEVLFFTGGYVGVPMALAGWGIPKAVYVPDIQPGLALGFIGRLAEAVMVTAEVSRAYYRSGKRILVTGYPTRPSLRGIRKEEARKALDLRQDLPVLLVFGGSRGARSINQALWSVLSDMLQMTQVLHITGQLDWPEVEKNTSSLPEGLTHRYRPYAYLHQRMGSALAAADLAVSRAGASALGELPLFGLPALLVPYPHAWRYQKVNARYLEQKGAAIYLPDQELKERLFPAVVSLLQDRSRLEGMAQASRDLAKPNAARMIAEELYRLSTEKGGRNG